MTDTLAFIAAELERSQLPCVTSSFQAECVVLVYMLREIRPDIPVLFLDTLHHFEATYRYRDQLAQTWQLNQINLRAADPVIGLWRSSTHDCCARHKVEPLFTALSEYDVWFTALRREQSASRGNLEETALFRLPGGETLRKVSPLAAWTTSDVLRYARVHEIPLLPLYEQGYTSIGCEPCTLPPPDPTNPRSGRWLGQKLECGIHLEGAVDGPQVISRRPNV